jgi:hypothetical protein
VAAIPAETGLDVNINSRLFAKSIEYKVKIEFVPLKIAPDTAHAHARDRIIIGLRSMNSETLTIANCVMASTWFTTPCVAGALQEKNTAAVNDYGYSFRFS